MKFYSQHKQDQYLYENHLKDIEDGVFLEIGAYDGVSFSNSCFFEKELGWKGICIEPNPKRFKELEKNRECVKVQGCISNSNEKAKYTWVDGPSDMLSGLSDEYDPQHEQRIDYEIQLYGGKREEFEVDCYLLTDLLEKNNMTHVNYCSLDVEGAELAILETIDFSKCEIDYWSIENNYRDSKIKKIMKKNGYELIEILDCDEIYRLKK